MNEFNENKNIDSWNCEKFRDWNLSLLHVGFWFVKREHQTKKIGSKENVCYNTYGIIRSALYKYQAIENIVVIFLFYLLGIVNKGISIKIIHTKYE